MLLKISVSKLENTLFLGGFHLHANDVTGRLSSSSLSSDPIVSSGVGVDVTLAGVISPRAWSNPHVLSALTLHFVMLLLKFMFSIFVNI